MTVEEIRAHCRAGQWQPRGSGIRWFEERPNFFPTWGDTEAEALESWQAILDAYTSGGNAPAFAPFDAVDIPRGGAWQAVVANGTENVGRKSSGSPIIEGVFFIECMDERCRREDGWRGKFKWQSRLGFRSVPEFCPEHRPQVTAQTFVEAETVPGRKPSPVKDAVVAAIARVRDESDVVLIADVLAEAVNQIPAPKGKDFRRSWVMQALRRMKSVKIDGDQLRLDC